MRQFKSLMLGMGVAAVVMGLAGCTTSGDGQRSAGRVVDDNRITEMVEEKLQNEPVYKFNEVDVRTFNGAVQLSGFVTTEDQKQRAARLAQSVEGVTQVFNSIALKTQLAPTGRTNNLAPVQEQNTRVTPDVDSGSVTNISTNAPYQP